SWRDRCRSARTSNRDDASWRSPLSDFLRNAIGESGFLTAVAELIPTFPLLPSTMAHRFPTRPARAGPGLVRPVRRRATDVPEEGRTGPPPLLKLPVRHQHKVNLFCGVGCYSPWSSSVLPAHAGMIRAGLVVAARPPCAPRTRGDDPPSSRQCHLPETCSPHTRG